jgi:hypothetical protein
MDTRRHCVLLFAVLLAACGGGNPKAPPGWEGRADLSGPFVQALKEEATGDPLLAKKLYLKSIDNAVQWPTDPYYVPILMASLDALVFRRVGALSEVTNDSALAFRTKDHVLLPGPRDERPRGTEEPEQVWPRIPWALRHADDPFTPGLLSRAMQKIAEHHGDVAEAEKWRAKTGCVRAATVVGPLAWAPVTGISDPDPLERFDAKIPQKTPLYGPFAAALAPVTVHDRGCAIELGAANALRGVRDVVVDVKIDKKGQTIGVGLWSTAPAIVRAGGRPVLERAYELGGAEVVRFARVDAASPGWMRLVARVGMDAEADSIQIGAWDEHGKPLETRAPVAGESANVAATGSKALAYPEPRTFEESTALAAGALAMGDGRTAERILARDAARAAAPPDLVLVYARALETARDLQPVNRAERARAAYEKVLDAWPTSWEASLAHAVLAGVRRGQSEQRIEALSDLDKRRAKAPASALALFDAFDAAASGREGLFDRSRAAFERAKTPLDATSLLYDAGRYAFERTGQERVAYACSDKAPNNRASLDCHDALQWGAGDRAGAEKELDRVRSVLGAKDAFLAFSLRSALATGDKAATTPLYDRMLPGERTLTALYTTAHPFDQNTVPQMAITARDAPHTLPALLHAANIDDPLKAFEGLAERVVEADRKNPIMPAAPTVLLSHTERYFVDPTGLLYFVMFDVRRVSGTTDVEENAQAIPPDLTGRDVMRILRRRIFKKDGRILSPDRTPHAAQSHADLSQLEQGDCVEAIYEGWALPGDTGNLGIDTPDVLSERTAVHEATIEMHLPNEPKGSLWAHALLGKPAVRTDEQNRRVLTWSLKDRPVRRLEDGVPKMDRSVSVSFGTADWKDVGRALKETLAALDEHDPEIADWAKNAAGGALSSKDPRATITAIVEASGSAVKEASPSVLVDLEGGADGAQSTTARTILSTHEGSRTWLVVRALRELGIPADVAVVENEPFSASPDFPPHFGRFMHPLAIAHVKGADVWIDADVPGPPLPAGRVSPELRGRAALYADGKIAQLPTSGGGESERDEVDVRLAVDAKGDAKGSLTVLLRGRAAQELAEALVRIVGAERQRALRAVALAWVPYANVDNVQLSSSEGSWQIALRAELSIPGYAQPEGGAGARTWVLPGVDPLHTMFPRAYVTTLGATYASRSGRENALAINHAVQYHAHRRIELPQGASVVRVPGPFETHARPLDASRKITVEGTVIEEEFVLGVATGTIAQDRYSAFVGDAHKTDDAFLASTRVKL